VSLGGGIRSLGGGQPARVAEGARVFGDDCG
jgi:hypothetical protein